MDSKTQYGYDVNSTQIVLQFNTVEINIPAEFFPEFNKLILIFLCKENRIAQIALKKKIKVGGPTPPKFQGLQEPRQYDTGQRIDTWVNGKEQRTQK